MPKKENQRKPDLSPDIFTILERRKSAGQKVVRRGDVFNDLRLNHWHLRDKTDKEFQMACIRLFAYGIIELLPHEGLKLIGEIKQLDDPQYFNDKAGNDRQ